MREFFIRSMSEFWFNFPGTDINLKSKHLRLSQFLFIAVVYLIFIQCLQWRLYTIFEKKSSQFKPELFRILIYKKTFKLI